MIVKYVKNFFVILFLLLVSEVVWSQKSPVFVTARGAIDGYDPVAFFKDHAPIRGSSTISYNWGGATWYFASEENKDAFATDPEKYSPQYGGYCAYGTADGHKAPTQADTWSIVDGKLYFNYNKQVQKSWSKNQVELIKKADENWPTVKDSQ
jgi:YHS domain-containing protein